MNDESNLQENLNMLPLKLSTLENNGSLVNSLKGVIYPENGAPSIIKSNNLDDFMKDSQCKNLITSPEKVIIEEKQFLDLSYKHSCENSPPKYLMSHESIFNQNIHKDVQSIISEEFNNFNFC